MDKDFLVQLAKKIYHLTVLFPKKEPLRYKMRELAIEILQKSDEQDFETLNNFFEVAKDQNWVKPDDILAMQLEYANLNRETLNPKQEKLFGASQGKAKIESKFQPLTAKTLAERHKKILAILKEKGKAQVWEMKQVFPQISKRTLRRDFEFLFKQGAIDRIGEKNNTYYQVKTG
ncbi:MAG: DeoR family transcriptional regulator [Patescibacteria group bacterium]